MPTRQCRARSSCGSGLPTLAASRQASRLGRRPPMHCPRLVAEHVVAQRKEVLVAAPAARELGFVLLERRQRRPANPDRPRVHREHTALRPCGHAPHDRPRVTVHDRVGADRPLATHRRVDGQPKREVTMGTGLSDEVATGADGDPSTIRSQRRRRGRCSFIRTVASCPRTTRSAAWSSATSHPRCRRPRPAGPERRERPRRRPTR